MKHVYLLLLFLGTFTPCFCQDEIGKIVLSSGDKTFSMFNKRMHHFEVTEDRKGDSMKFYTTSIKGALISANSNLFKIIPTKIKTTRIGQDSVIKYFETRYPKYSSPVSIRSSDISLLTIQSKSAYRCQVAGAFFIIAGSLAVSLIAPLACIDYRNGQMNSNVYYKFVAVGLGCFAVGLPLVYSSYERKFNLKRSKGSKEKVWEIVK